MGPYCKFCNTRCFVPRDLIVSGETLWSGIMATCTKGAELDRRILGADYRTAHNPRKKETMPETTNADKLIGRVDALLRARNEASQAQQRYADARVNTEPDDVTDALYEATGELIHRIDNLIDNIDWQNLILGLQK